MKINKINFCRTIKVNAPLNIAQRAANLVNSCSSYQDEISSQKLLKEIFYDSKSGEACAFTLGNPYVSYIMSGKESQLASKYYNQMFSETDDINCENYNSLLEYNKQIKELIENTKEDKFIQVKYDQLTKHINSINLSI